MSLAGVASAQESIRLTDVVKSNGTRTIDFFKDLTADQLEQLRVDNGGAIAIDVNESADGTDKSSAQAVALALLTLPVTYSGNTQAVYDPASGCFATRCWVSRDPAA